MQFGRTIIHFERGEIKGIYTNAGLDQFYYRMFKRAKRAAKRHLENPENGIEVIIFGAFYLESICNELFKEMLSKQILLARLSASIWEVTKRLNIIDKLKVAISSLNSTDSNKYLNKAQKIFALRNRLAHFKDTDFFWLGTTKGDKTEDIINVLKNAPEPELMKELTGEKIEEYATDVEGLDKWIRRLFGHFLKTKIKNIKIKG